MWPLFGGRSEDRDKGSPAATVRREMQEELGVVLSESQVQPLAGFGPYPGPVGFRHVFVCEWHDPAASFDLGEGEALAWFEISEALQLANLSDFAHAALKHLRDRTELLSPRSLGTLRHQP
jgi:8-oxo-dGTP pyrophosphatase MutT (NUDIX family)